MMKKQTAMFALCFMLLAAFAVSIPVRSAAQSASSRYALVIGNADYKNIKPSLPNTLNDAADIAAALGKLGYQVTVHKNIGIAGFDAAVEQFVGKLARDPQSEGFFWYAGHGTQIDGENYLLPTDITGTETKTQIERGSYSLNALLNEFERAQNKVNVVILDACRNNPLQSTARGGAARGLAVVSAVPRDLVIMYSTAAGNTADDGTDSRNSPFTQAFLKNIGNPEPFSAVLADVTKETLALTGNRQRPFQAGSIVEKNYSLAGISTPPSAVPPRITPAVQPAAPSNPFATVPGERWQGRISYQDGGKNYSDLYEIIFVPNGTCIVSIKTTENGAELFQDGDGLWSFDDNFLRIECDFFSRQIERLPGIRWVSVYQFDTLKNRFTLLVPPYPDARNNVRAQFIKTGD
jgi:hypothetical protein